jgi:hypothetical protein
MTNALTTLSTLEQRITEVNERLAPAGDDAVAKAIRSLQVAGLGLPDGMDPKGVNMVYSYALAGLSDDALNIAVKKIIRGEYDINRAFIPKPPELAAIVRAEARVITDDLVRLKATADAMRPAEQAKVSEEGKARIRKMLEEYRASHRLAKEAERGNVVPEVTPERIDMLSRIMALPDAKEITAEQMANRRAAAALIERNSGNAEDAA